MSDDPRWQTEEEPTETDDEIVARLAKLSPLDYDRQRHATAKRMVVHVGTLDKAVARVREASEAAGERRAGVHQQTPWEHPVDLATLLDDLAAAIRRHMVMPKRAADAAALWIAHTWVHERFERTPRLAITSPVKRCGKSTLLDILHATSRRSIRADNISASGVFRTVEVMAPVTLIIDEADSFLNENEELRGVLNSGFACDGQVIRVTEIQGKQTPVMFSTFAPVALAAIKRIPDTIADRSVPIRLARKAKGEKVTMLRAKGSRAALAVLGRKLARWAADAGDQLNVEPPVPDAMGDREGDICVPLLSIADQAGVAWSQHGRAALLDVFGTRAKDEGDSEIGAMLLGDIKQLFAGKGSVAMRSRDLCAGLATYDERPWPEWRNGKPITPTQLARALSPFKVRPTTIRFSDNGGGTDKGYLKEAFVDAWSRYVPPDPTPEPEDGNDDEGAV